MNQTMVIIGAGIIGLHCAHIFREKGHEVYVLEKEPFLGEHCSGRNSGVIHAGIYYESGSLKEKFCIEGNQLTYDWLKELNVDHRPCGKWVVPLPGQDFELEPFFERICQLPISTPLLKKNAIFIPSTGIMDTAGYLKSYATYLECRGVTIVLNCQMMSASDTEIETTRGPIPYDLGINCAGLWSDEIASITGLHGYTIRPCRGDYYAVHLELFDCPVYHLPLKGSHGLGLHVTPTLEKQTLIGPNDFYIEKKDDYQHRSASKEFEDSLKNDLNDSQLRTGDFPPLTKSQSGNRPKLFKQTGSKELIPLNDFLFLKQKNWIHCLGIESPGLTAAPAIARHVMALS